MDLSETLVEIIEAVQQELDKTFAESDLQQNALGAFGKRFYKEFSEYLSSGGKRIRPFLVKTAFDAVGGDPTQGNIIRASLAIELLHNGSLLHDDVIDKDETRRGNPAFHVIFREYYKEKIKKDNSHGQDFGEAMSIFAGDLCFPFAIESIIKSGFPAENSARALQAFSEAFREVIDGVIIETGDTILHDSDENTYRKMVSLKTGALIRKSVEIGAILGNGTESQIKALTSYCEGLGTAFQIQDDILGVFGDPDEIGKPVGGDIRENKQTILRIHAKKHANPSQKKRLDELLGKEDLTENELEEVQLIFEDTGSFSNARVMIKQSTENSILALEEANPPLKKEPKNLLIALAKYLENRSK
ncbi:MAG: polyprenyl synthetase family protein [Asgard group archaeon]|nr:polyprenyl synthetase family protein [Asgard group archaeon]